MNNGIKIDMHSVSGKLECVALSGACMADFYIWEIIDSLSNLDTIPESVRTFIRVRFDGADWRLLSGGGIQLGSFYD